MGTIFMNSENSKNSEPYVLILKLINKLDLQIGGKVHIITINLKYLHLHGMINLNCLMDRILYQIFKIILNTF